MTSRQWPPNKVLIAGSMKPNLSVAATGFFASSLLALEVILLVTRNSSDFALISNSTTCKITSALPNSDLYSFGGALCSESTSPWDKKNYALTFG